MLDGVLHGPREVHEVFRVRAERFRERSEMRAEDLFRHIPMVADHVFQQWLQ